MNIYPLFSQGMQSSLISSEDRKFQNLTPCDKTPAWKGAMLSNRTKLHYKLFFLILISYVLMRFHSGLSSPVTSIFSCSPSWYKHRGAFPQHDDTHQLLEPWSCWSSENYASMRRAKWQGSSPEPALMKPREKKTEWTLESSKQVENLGLYGCASRADMKQ